MNKDLEFKNLWNTPMPVVPSEQEIIEKAKNLKHRIQLRAGLGIFSLLITMGVIFWVAMNYDFQIWSTMTGIFLVMSALILSILNSIRTLFTPKIDPSLSSNRGYLEQLIVMKDQQHFTQTILMSTYFALLSGGLMLYMYEPASNMPGFYGWIAYGVTFLWIGFNWFYLRPRIIKKQRAKMDETIENLRSVHASMEDSKQSE